MQTNVYNIFLTKGKCKFGDASGHKVAMDAAISNKFNRLNISSYT